MDNNYDQDHANQLERAVQDLLTSWDRGTDGFAEHVNRLRQALAYYRTHKMKVFLHRYYIHQHNTFPPQEAQNVKNFQELVQHTQQDPTVIRIEDRLFEWVATKNYDRMGKPIE